MNAILYARCIVCMLSIAPQWVHTEVNDGFVPDPPKWSDFHRLRLLITKHVLCFVAIAHQYFTNLWSAHVHFHLLPFLLSIRGLPLNSRGASLYEP